MKRILLVAAVILVAALGIFFRLQQERTEARRLAEWEAERTYEPTAKVLSQRFKWERAELTLGEFADLIDARSGLKVEIDDASIYQNITVTVPAGEFKLQDTLWMVLAPVPLVADVRGQKIVITTVANSDRGRMRTVVYPVPQPKPAGMNQADWRELIAANIDGHAVETPGAIIVVANSDSQKRARLVIDTICSLREGASGTVTIPPPESREMEERIWSELGKQTNVDLVEMPLKDVIFYLSDLHGIPLILRADKLREASVAVDTPITKTLRQLSLRSALNLMLKDLELTFAVRDQALMITTPEDAEAQMRTVAYSLKRLEAMGAIVDLDAFEKVMVSTIEPGMWRTFGGPGLVHRADGKWLIIQQTSEILGRVNALFNTLQQMLAEEDHVASQSIVPADVAEQKIRTALEGPLSVQFKGMLLKDAAEYIGEALNIPILLSLKKLEEAWISPDTPIHYTAKEIPARIALEEMLTPMRLAFVVRDEVVQITTPDEPESHLVTRIYDARTILMRLPPERLRELMLKTIKPNSWFDTARGPGDAEFYRGLMIVTQTEQIHEEIERLVVELTTKPAEDK